MSHPRLESLLLPLNFPDSHSRVKPAVSDKLFSRVEPVYILSLTNKMHSGNISNAFNGFDNFNILRQRSFFTGPLKELCYNLEASVEEEKLSNLSLKDEFSYREKLSDRVFRRLFIFKPCNLLGDSFSLTGRFTEFFRKRDFSGSLC